MKPPVTNGDGHFGAPSACARASGARPPAHAARARPARAGSAARAAGGRHRGQGSRGFIRRRGRAPRPGRGAAVAMGTTRRKRQPRASLRSRERKPPAWRASWWLSTRPMPPPPGLVLLTGWKSCSRTTGARPGPSSSTRNKASAPWRVMVSVTRPPRGVASQALRRRLSSTSRTRWARRPGRSASSSRRATKLTPWAAAQARIFSPGGGEQVRGGYQIPGAAGLFLAQDGQHLVDERADPPGGLHRGAPFLACDRRIVGRRLGNITFEAIEGVLQPVQQVRGDRADRGGPGGEAELLVGTGEILAARLQLSMDGAQPAEGPRQGRQHEGGAERGSGAGTAQEIPVELRKLGRHRRAVDPVLRGPRQPRAPRVRQRHGDLQQRFAPRRDEFGVPDAQGLREDTRVQPRHRAAGAQLRQVGGRQGGVQREGLRVLQPALGVEEPQRHDSAQPRGLEQQRKPVGRFRAKAEARVLLRGPPLLQGRHRGDRLRFTAQDLRAQFLPQAQGQQHRNQHESRDRGRGDDQRRGEPRAELGGRARHDQKAQSTPAAAVRTR